MLRVLTSVISHVIGWGGGEVQAQEEEDHAIQRSNELLSGVHFEIFRESDNNDINLAPASASAKQSLFEQLFLTGTVTRLSASDGVIDNKHYFDRKIAGSAALDFGKKVTYQVYRKSQDQEWIVAKIISVHDEMWDEDNDVLEDNTAPEIVEEEVTGSANQRFILGKVLTRDGREVVVRDIVQQLHGGSIPRDTRFDLDNVKSDFIPVKGDLIRLDAIVEVSEETVDGSVDVLEVLSITPAISRKDEGFVTKWVGSRSSNRNNHRMRPWGIISNDVYFEKNVCDDGYIPKVNDLVTVDMIQCDKGEFKWRALLVVPKQLTQHLEEHRKKPDKLLKVDPGLLKNKCNLVVQENTDFGTMPADGSYRIEIAVSNVGNTKKKITKFYFDTEFSNLSVITPRDKTVTIEPQDTFTFSFDYNKSVPGFFNEMFIIQCDNEEIGRELKWEVQTSMDLFAGGYSASVEDKKAFEDLKTHQSQKYFCALQNRNVVCGPQPKKSPSFVTYRIRNYELDKQIRNAMTLGSEGRLVGRKEAKRELQECCPEAFEPPTALNHSRKFHHLLFIAEVDGEIGLSRHTKERVSFVRRGQASEYLALEIPGLADGRPSVIVGDSILACSSAVRNGAAFRGFIHKVLKTEIWLKFDAYFHQSYCNEDYDIFFRQSRGCFRKCHAALDICHQNQANLWLFPKGVRVKPPQVSPEVLLNDDLVEFGQDHYYDENSKLVTNENSESSLTEKAFEEHKSENLISLEVVKKTCNNEKPSKLLFLDSLKPKNRLLQSPTEKIKLSEPHKITNVKKMQWINSRLNQRQKDAVRNILLGEARPLPYIIFGPPGTGKTVTLVEAILQIYFNVEGSRILIATPSNSSANLVAERLIDHLPQGDMVRLVAFHLVTEGKIPPKLVPYSATVDISANTADDPEEREGIKNLNSKLIMSNRIVIGTCMALGQMISLGLPRGHFSHIVVDEAGQATEPEILIPLGFMAHETGQAILAGDPNQLGPVVPSAIAGELGLSKSLLARLIPRFPYQRDETGFPESGGYDPRLVTRLSVNYRSLPDILELPSALFYDSDLEPSISDTNSFEAKLLARITPALKLPHSAIIFFGVKGRVFQDQDSPSYYNLHEAFSVTSFVTTMLEAEVKGEDIGIITPYQKQASKIREFLEKCCGSHSLSIKVGSVEEFQGQERMVIILSTVRSLGCDRVEEMGRNTVRQLLGFVNNKERLNVAITRARSLLLVIGDPTVLSVDHYWRNVVKYCVDKGAYCGTTIQKNMFDD